MARVLVSEFSLRSLDRAARLAGEAFGSDDAAGRETEVEQAVSNSVHLWLMAAVLGLAGFIYLVQ